MLAHLAVGIAYACFWHESGEPFFEDIHGFDIVIDEIHLSAAGDLLEYRLTDESVGIFGYIGLHRITRFGRSIYNAHIPNAAHAHMERARYGRGGERQHIDTAFQLLDLLLMVHSETLFLINDKKPEVVECDILSKQAVRTDDDVYIAFFQFFLDLFAFSRGLEA